MFMFRIFQFVGFIDNKTCFVYHIYINIDEESGNSNMRLKFLVVILPFEAFFTHVYNVNGGFPSVMEINNISVTNLITNNLISDHVVHRWQKYSLCSSIQISC